MPVSHLDLAHPVLVQAVAEVYALLVLSCTLLADSRTIHEVHIF